MTGEKTKFCVNCKHHSKTKILFIATCLRTQVIHIDFVSGKKWKTSPDLCDNQRHSGYSTSCGLDAKFYEEKESFLIKIKKWVGGK